MGIVVDSFAGGGGASEALEAALGRIVDIAINHSADAIATHLVNHPRTRHLTEDLTKAKPIEAIRGQPIDVAWFSPDCKHFSKAKGGKPVSKEIRGLAWVVLKWAALPKALRPKVIFLENVQEFEDWCPLGRDNKPIKSRRGETFRLWVSHLRALGYDRIEWRRLRACDYGAPTIRERLFLVARCDGLPIVWPEPSHGAPGSLEIVAAVSAPYRTAAECIDWSLPCPSIFLTKEEGRALGVKRPLAEATMRRIALGVKRYVLDAAEPFIVGCGGRMGQSPARPVSSPFQTLTAKADSCVVVPTLIQTGYGERKGQAPRVPGLEKPLGTAVAGGAKHALVAAFLAQHNTMPNGGIHPGHDVRKPISTVTATGCQQAIVASHLISLKGSDRRMSRTDEPAPAITAGGFHVGEVRAFLLKYYGTDQDPRLDEPLHTVTTKDRFGLVTVEIAGESYVIADIGMRMLTPDELKLAQGFRPDYIIDRTADGRRLPNSVQVLHIGNSVSPPPAEALIRANASMYAAGAIETRAAQ